MRHDDMCGKLHIICYCSSTKRETEVEVDKTRRIGRNKIWRKCQWAWVSFAVQVMESQPRALKYDWIHVVCRKYIQYWFSILSTS